MLESTRNNEEPGFRVHEYGNLFQFQVQNLLAGASERGAAYGNGGNTWAGFITNLDNSRTDLTVARVTWSADQNAVQQTRADWSDILTGLGSGEYSTVSLGFSQVGSFAARDVVLDSSLVESYSGSTRVPSAPLIPLVSGYFGGHHYEVYGGQHHWVDAWTYAHENGGYLVSITSAAENTFVTHLNPASLQLPFIGLSQNPTASEPRSGWGWDSGEALTFSAWNVGEPNNSGGVEHWAMLWGNGTVWNDTGSVSEGFIVEYNPTFLLSADATHVDEGHSVTFTLRATHLAPGSTATYRLTGISTSDIVGGSLVGSVTLDASGVGQFKVAVRDDANTEGLETLTATVEAATSSVTINDTSVENPLATGYFGGHHYEVYGGARSWASAQQFAHNLGGYLISLGSAEESSFITALNPASLRWPYIGLYQTPGASEPSGGWAWDSGEPVIYSAWAAGEPNDNLSREDWGMLWGDGTVWNDGYDAQGFIVEFNPTYTLTANSTQVDEGQAVTFSLRTTHVQTGQSLTYRIGGVAADDVVGGTLGGLVTVDASGSAIWSVTLREDARLEGNETLRADIESASSTVTVRDTSTVGNPPTLINPIADQAALENQAFSFTLPDNSFADPDVGDTLTFTTSALPPWLCFDAATRTFSGTPANSDVDRVNITVRATDGFGASASDNFVLTVGNTNDAPRLASPIADQTASEGTPFSFRLPAGTFVDSDATDSLRYGTGQLPAWLSFNTSSQTFSGTPGAAHVGAVMVRVTATDLADAFAEDSFVLTVANINEAPSGSATISGATEVGQTLSAVTSAIGDADGLGSFAYQWLANGNAIAGATASNFTLGSAQLGQTLAVRVSYIDGGGTAESLTSAPTAAVADGTPGLRFTGTTGLTTTEAGGSASFGVALAAAPRHDVSVTFSISDSTEGSFGVSGADAVATRTLTFTPSNWATAQTVTLTGVDDSPNDGDMAFVVSTRVSSADLRYDGMRSGSGLGIANIAVINSDDDAPDEQYGDAGGMALADQLIGGNGASDLYGMNGRDELHGGRGDDRLYGGYGDDVLYGEADHDELEGDQGNDLLDGGSGNDTLTGGTGRDTLRGGDGNDTLDGSSDADSMDGGNGSDTYYVDNSADVVTDAGSDGATDTVYIASYLSTTYTLGGGIENGTLDSNAGSGGLNGNTGANTLTGNSGNNALDGGAGNDSLAGGSGNDTLTGGAGSDTAVFGADSSTINLSTGSASGSTEGTDTLSGMEAVDAGAGNDTVIGSMGNDTVLGGGGNDSITAGAGNDSVDAGDGNDLIVGGDGAGNDRYAGGAGTDTLRYTSAITGIAVNLAAGTASGNEIGSDTLSQIENVIGGQAGDVINGDGLANVLDGYTGNDSLLGGAGNDSLIGGAGHDTLNGGTGNDSLSGGAGDDLYLVDAAGDVVVETTGAGTDRIWASVNYTLGAGVAVESMSLAGSATQLAGNELANTLWGSSLADTLAGLAGNDSLSGAAGNDSLNGGTGNDSMAGGDGNDTLDGGAGTDSLSGGAGDDLYLVDAASDVVLEATGAGSDRIWASANYTLGTGVAVESMSLTGSATRLTGNELTNTLWGSAQADSLAGLAGNDSLSGAAANDSLCGGSGNDSLAGGLGRDTFRFDSVLNALTNVDRISDFSVVDDTVELENAIFTALTSTGTLAAAAFVANVAGRAMDASDRVVYDSDGGQLYFDADGSGSGTAVLFALLSPGLALTAGDFLVT